MRLAVVGTLSCAAPVAMLRSTGTRTLARMDAVDLVVTVALGSTFASALLTSSVSLAEAVGAFALLGALHYGVAMLSVRSERFQRFVKAQPTLLDRRGVLEPATRRERVTREGIFAAIRARVAVDLGSVAAVVVETDGSFSVLTGAAPDGPATLAHVSGAPPGAS